MVTGNYSKTGLNTNLAPSAGFIGELMIGANNSGTALTSGAISMITSVTLTPGNWEITGQGLFQPTGANTGVNVWETLLSATSAGSVPIEDQGGSISTGLVQFTGDGIFPIVGQGNLMQNVGPCRVSISSNTTYYLNVQGTNFTTATVNANGFGVIRAVRAG